MHLLTVSHVPSLCWLMLNPWNPGNCFICAARSAHVAWKCSSFSSGTRNLQHKPHIKQLLVDHADMLQLHACNESSPHAACI